MRVLKSIAALAMALALTAPAVFCASNEKFAFDLPSRNEAGKVDVIVQYKTSPTEANHQKVSNLGGV